MKRTLGACGGLAGLLLAIAAAPAWGQTLAANLQPPLLWLKTGDYARLDAHFADLQRAYEAGLIPVLQLQAGFHELYDDTPASAPYFDAWVRKFPHSYVARTFRGAYYYRMALAIRGTDYVNNTAPERLNAMEGGLERARPELVASLKLTAKPFMSALYLLDVSQLGGTQEESRHWFDVGNRIDSGSTTLKERYMATLEPRWGGSYQQMAAFRQECAQAHVPPAELARLDIIMHTDAAFELTDANQSGAAFEHLQAVRELSTVAGEHPSDLVLGLYARFAWDLKRRAQADEALRELSQRNLANAYVLSQMGYIYVQERRLREAWTALGHAAALGDAWSQFAVGKTTYLGCADLNLGADRTAGLEWMRRSAAQGFGEAKAFLAAVGAHAPLPGGPTLTTQALGSPSAAAARAP